MQELITNDQVKEMVRDTLTQEGDLKLRLQDAIFEPKLTRSKLKEVIQSGQVGEITSLCVHSNTCVFVAVRSFRRSVKQSCL